MAKSNKKSHEVIKVKAYKKVITKTLEIKAGDWVNTSNGWKETSTDAYRNDNGIICVDIAAYGTLEYMSHDQSITIKR